MAIQFHDIYGAELASVMALIYLTHKIQHSKLRLRFFNGLCIVF